MLWVVIPGGVRRGRNDGIAQLYCSGWRTESNVEVKPRSRCIVEVVDKSEVEQVPAIVDGGHNLSDDGRREHWKPQNKVGTCVDPPDSRTESHHEIASARFHFFHLDNHSKEPFRPVRL